MRLHAVHKSQGNLVTSSNDRLKGDEEHDHYVNFSQKSQDGFLSCAIIDPWFLGICRGRRTSLFTWFINLSLHGLPPSDDPDSGGIAEKYI